jgi:single-strand DNA-binding protein
MAENNVTIVGNLTDDPELRFTPSGRPVATFTVAVNKRFRNNDGAWEDRLDGFFRCNVWADMAENVSESLAKGTRVVVTGRLNQRSWEEKEGGARRSAVEIQVDEVGPSLRWAMAKVTKPERKGAQGGQQGQSWGGGQQQQQPAPSYGAPAQQQAPSYGGAPAQQQPPQQQPPQQQPQESGDWGSPSPVGSPAEEGGF